MKKTLLTIAAILALASPAAIRAQITSTVTTQTHDPSFSMGRDFWFSFMSNYWGENLGGAYLAIYITSPVNTIAYIEYGPDLIPIPITTNQVSAYYPNLDWELQSSGEVESKAVHVYSKNADLVVYVMNHNSASTDGEYIIPTIGWGKDYVVAAYGSYFAGFADTYDFPSTLAITANEDNTIVTITPSCDCRQSWTGDGGINSVVVVFPAGKTFTDTLNVGQDLELMPVLVTGPTGYDLTGTIIHATKPIGLQGGSEITNIPVEFPYDDHVEDMLPPVRTWGETYFATNPYDSLANHNYAQYLFIASVANQTIFRHDCDSADHTECIIPDQYGIYWDEIAGPQKFFSDQPFLVVEYHNGGSYPDGATGLGGPAEAHLNPREQYTKTVTFETPIYVGSKYPDPYVNYANIAVNIKDTAKTFLDGEKIDSIPGQCIDGSWEIFTFDSLTPGTHTVTGDDSGVGVNVYGYGFDETYEWSSPSSVATFQSRDTTAPLARTATECYNATVHLADTSGLAMIRLDSDNNMTYIPDPNFIEGSGIDTASYALYITFLSKPAFLQITEFDFAGNSTTITNSYEPNTIEITPPLQNLGVWLTGQPPNVAYDTIYNLGQTTLDISELQLKYGDVGFSIFDSIGGPVDLSPLPAGNRRLIQIHFVALQPTVSIDSILFGNDCESQSVGVIGSGGANDFIVTNQTWPDELLPASLEGYQKTVEIENLSANSITIDSAWWADTIHFKAVSAFPVALAASPGQVAFTIAYFPDSASQYVQDRTQGSWYSHNVLQSDGVTPSPRYDSLIGWALAPSGVQNSYSPSLQASIIPTNNGRSLEIILPTNLTAPAHFELVNVLGQNVLGTTLGTQIETIDASALPRGVYFYRITLGSMNQMGKVILGQ